MGKQIFIGGTGRCGTTILAEVIGSHPEIHAFKQEMRFLTDPDGLVQLCDSLSTSYSPTQSRQAIARFTRLMLSHLTRPMSPPYIGFDFRRRFGNTYYENHVEQLLAEITFCKYYGSDYYLEGDIFERLASPILRVLERIINARRKLPYMKGRSVKRFRFVRSRLISEGKYYADRSQLTDLCGKFVDHVFSYAANEHKKTHWCEQTPGNAMYASFLQELLPKCYFICITRDPRGVANSFRQQTWSPNKTEDVCRLIANSYDKWFAERDRLQKAGGKVLEVRLEDLSQHCERELSRIAEFLGLTNEFPGARTLAMNKVNYWSGASHQEFVDEAASLLSAYVEKTGYAA